MASVTSVEDLQLVDALVRHGSLGAAARELRITQPSASQRLSALERRLGVALFERSTAGTRPTAAGEVLAREADHILDHLTSLAASVAAAAAARQLRIGTVASLAGLVFPALDEVLPDGLVAHGLVDHGEVLVARIAAGVVDAAVVAVAQDLRLPAGVSGLPLGGDELTMVVPDGAAAPRHGRMGFGGRRVWFHTPDAAAEALRLAIAAKGGVARRAETAEVALVLAARHREVALVPRAMARHHGVAEAELRDAPVRHTTRLTLVARDPAPADLAAAVPAIADAMGLGR